MRILGNDSSGHAGNAPRTVFSKAEAGLEGAGDGAESKPVRAPHTHDNLVVRALAPGVDVPPISG